MSRAGGVNITLNTYKHVAPAAESPGPVSPRYAGRHGGAPRVHGYAAHLAGQRTPGYIATHSVGGRRAAPPDGLRLGSDGRLRTGGTPSLPRSPPQFAPPVDLYEDGGLPHPASTTPTQPSRSPSRAAAPLFEPMPRHTTRVDPLSLERYAVARRARSPGVDDHRPSRTLRDAVHPRDDLASPRNPSPGAWHRAHLSVPRLPDASLASPQHTLTPRGPPRVAQTTQSIRVQVLTSEGLAHVIELPNGLQTTVNEVLSTVLLMEPERVGSHEKFAPHLEFGGRRLHPYDTLEEVGAAHLSTLLLQRRGEVRVEAPPRRPDGSVADFVARFTGGPRNLDPFPVRTERVGAHKGYADPFFPPPGASTPPAPPNKPLPASKIHAGPKVPGVPGVEAFEFGTPIEQFLDTNTKRIVLQDQAGSFAAVYEDGIVPLKNHPLRFYLIDLFKDKDPARLANVDRMLWDAEGREDELIQRLYNKYGVPDVLYEDYVQYRKQTRPFQPGNAVEKFIDEQTFERVFVDDLGQYCVYPYEPGQPIVPMSDHPTRQWLIDFLRHHAKRRLPEVDHLLWEHQWSEDRLRRLCVEVYGPAPIPPYHEYVTNHVAEKKKRAQQALERPPDAPFGRSDELNDEPGDAKAPDSLVDGGLPPVPDTHPLRLFLIDYFNEKNDLEKLSLVEKFVRDYDGFEETLLERVMFQGGPSQDLSYESYVDQARQFRNSQFTPGQPVDDFLDENTFTSVFLDEFGQYCVVPLVEKYGIVPMSFHPMRDWLIDFFRHHSKRDLADVDFLLWEHQWQEEKLRKTCIDAYGNAPIPPYEEYLRKRLKKEADEASKRREALDIAQQFPDVNLAPRQTDIIRTQGDWKEIRSANKRYYYNEKEQFGTFDIRQTPFTSHDDESVFTDDSDPLGPPLDHSLPPPPSEDKKGAGKKSDDPGSPDSPKKKKKKKKPSAKKASEQPDPGSVPPPKQAGAAAAGAQPQP